LFSVHIPESDVVRRVDRLVAAMPQAGNTPPALALVRLRALVARTRGDEPTYRELVGRYRAMAASLGFDV